MRPSGGAFAGEALTATHPGLSASPRNSGCNRRFVVVAVQGRTELDSQCVFSPVYAPVPFRERHPPDRGPLVGRRFALGDRRDTPTLYAADQFPRKVAWLSLARAVRVVRHGRALLARRRAVHRVEPDSCAAGPGRRRLAVAERESAPCAQDDRLVKVAAILAMVPDWNAFLNSAVPEEEMGELRRHVPTARPLGDETFLGRLEEMAGRALKPQKRGPKPKHRAN